MKPKKAQTGLIINEVKTEKPEANQQDNADLEICATDLLAAIQRKDIKAMAEAMRSAFEILESQPHEEAADHETSYDSLNALAAKNQR